MIIWYFGLPDAVWADTSVVARPDREYDAEDTALVQFRYDSGLYGLPVLAQPRLDQAVEGPRVKAGAAGRGDVFAYEDLVQVGWELLEDGGVLADQAEERGSPGSQGHGIDQGQAPIGGSVQQVGSQGDSAAEIVGHHGRVGQTPMGQQLGEDPTLGGQRDRSRRVTRGRIAWRDLTTGLAAGPATGECDK